METVNLGRKFIFPIEISLAYREEASEKISLLFRSQC